MKPVLSIVNPAAKGGGALQMHAGSARAQSRVLRFLHADTRLATAYR